MKTPARFSLATRLVLRGLLVPVLFAGAGQALGGESVADRLVEGNESFRAGAYDQASSAYEAALDLDPDSASILYNLGNVAFARGEWDEAEERYREARRNLRGEEGLERKILYNLGNTFFRRGMATAEESPERAIEILEQAADFYLDVIDRTREVWSRRGEPMPRDLDAAHNLEVVRLRIKELLDRMKEEEEEEEQQETPEDPVELLVAWIDSERPWLAGVEALESGGASPDLRARVIEPLADAQRENAGRADAVLEALDAMASQAAAAASPGPGGPGMAPGGPGAAPGAPGGGPAPELLDAARDAVGAARALQEQSAEQIAAGDTTSALLSGERSLDPLVNATTALEPLRGLERRALVALDAQERVLRGTLGLEADPSSDPAPVEARQAGNVERTGRLVQGAESLAELAEQAREQIAAQVDPATPGDADPRVRRAARTVEGLRRAGDEAGSARERQASATEQLTASRHAQAAADSTAAVEHLRAAHEALADLLKDWVQVLADAVRLQREVVAQASGAAVDPADFPEGVDPEQLAASALDAQTRNLATTQRVLDDLALEIQAAKMAQQLGAQPGGAGGAPGGGAPGPAVLPGAPPGPDLEEIDGLVREALDFELGARGRLEASDAESAIEPATRALEKLEEALEKAGADSDSGDRSQQGDDEQQEEPGEQGEDEQDPKDPSSEEDSPEDPQAEQPPDPDEGQGQPEAAPEQLTPREAMERLLEMLAAQEDRRQELEEQYRVRSRRRPPVEKDW